MRLIDADILLKRIEQSKLYNPHTDIAFKRAHETEHCHFLHMVIDMPTVKPKQGEWTIKNGELAVWDVCSICKKMVMHKAPFYNYCPHCGAEMKGKDNAVDAV